MLLERLAPAKINLGLHVLCRRPDGYHDLETVFLRIGWADRLAARPGADLRMTCSDPALPTDERNLCVKAARALQRAFGVTHGAALHLEKHVPYGAGLGGGSSDAAATLLLLSDLWDLDAPPDRLHALAAGLGSDVPFFLGPEAAFATGRGEHLTPLMDPATGTPYRFPFALVVAVPPVHVATVEAYRLVRPRATGRPDLRAVVTSNDLARWRAELVNDFEAPVMAAFPGIRAAREVLLKAGAGYAALSGSGAAVFGVFEAEAAARAAAEAARQAGCRVWTNVAP
ncbi:4-(cytidine 5'-diphospho)-2-C-methyl-D-erythritol kinase [Rhodocaloribacter litoris]|uniref:4-(cytidine 5'-diphospho)-2-C-methyl-D-erythritol kinase n=1 Tax=Rhodocaloribacter litoris TaxID=2558931 RepID=UPI001421E815|nr:4-(cytidine 5'-diphospho)-2-C-methyl-D-erythritol kinase [Rhodocaloribacter litoris]QXD15878.1 4-(cytidine 5'-diphospho)-2-C-methyl-D-erythritol kinase [Rhodocaloribacter litoris]